MQRFDSVIQYNAIILSVLLKYIIIIIIIIITSCSLVHTAIFKCNINNKVNYSLSIVQGDKIY